MKDAEIYYPGSQRQFTDIYTYLDCVNQSVNNEKQSKNNKSQFIEYSAYK